MKQPATRNLRSPASSIGIYSADPCCTKQAEELAAQTGFPLVGEERDCQLAVILRSTGLSLTAPGDPNLTGEIRVDFTTPAWTRRLKRVREEQLVKAMGKKMQPGTTLIDATGGLGRDTFLLAAAGFQVHTFEQNRILAALLSDGLQRARKQNVTREICKRIHFTQGNAIDFLCNNAGTAEVIYLDPMFPASKTTAKVKKELQIIQRLVGESAPPDTLFAQARQATVRRVVVKRPKKSPWLTALQPAYALTGKTIRFDVYL